MIISDDPEAIRRVLLGSKTIAVVGCSNKPDRDSYQIAASLIDRGFDVIPVNPGAAEILGRKCYPDVKSIPKKVDIVGHSEGRSQQPIYPAQPNLLHGPAAYLARCTSEDDHKGEDGDERCCVGDRR